MTITKPKTQGEAMRSARMYRGLSVSDLRDMSGIGAPTISSLELDRRSGTLDTVCALADALGIGLDEYIGRETPGHDGPASLTLEYLRSIFSTESDEDAHRHMAEAIGRALLDQGYIRIRRNCQGYGDIFIANIQVIKEGQK